LVDEANPAYWTAVHFSGLDGAFSDSDADAIVDVLERIDRFVA
jgi:hypothetical protein